MLGNQHPGDTSGGSDAGGQSVELIEWDSIFASVCANLCWTWTQAEEQLDLHRLQALTREWRANPPVHHLVANYLEYKPPQAAHTPEHDDSLVQMMSMMPVDTSAPRMDTSAWESFASPKESTDV